MEKYDNFDSRCGVCPKCKRKNPGTTDQLLNVRSTHFFTCERCKTAWYVGSHMFSVWEHETEDVWVRNWKMLESEYEQVEPYHPL